MRVYERGEIWLVDFNPAKGGEMGKLRPAVILSGAEENRLLDTVIVIPLSTRIEPDTLPYRHTISQRDKLEYDSDACIYEIRSLAKTRIKSRLGHLEPDELKTVQESLCHIVYQ